MCQDIGQSALRTPFPLSHPAGPSPPNGAGKANSPANPGVVMSVPAKFARAIAPARETLPCGSGRTLCRMPLPESAWFHRALAFKWCRQRRSASGRGSSKAGGGTSGRQIRGTGNGHRRARLAAINGPSGAGSEASASSPHPEERPPRPASCVPCAEPMAGIRPSFANFAPDRFSMIVEPAGG